MANNLLILSLVALTSIIQVSGHGYMFKPINRASRWRLNKEDQSIPHCYEDNQFYCGGMTVQYGTNGGLCGSCGDNYLDPLPRSNENGGTYGNGVVVESYYAGSVIDIDIRITANHLGNMSFQLCKLEDFDLPEPEDCFQPINLPNGNYYLPVDGGQFNISTQVQLPEDVICERCVLRWHYVAGNNWNSCDDGTYAAGCGPQETFRSCADIIILDPEADIEENLVPDA